MASRSRHPRSPASPRATAVEICRQLRDHGYTAYLAGGCVRDRLLGLEPEDYDVATDARPERVRELFKHARYVGEAFGVVLVPMGKQQTEVATFRLEWGYADGRRPDHVEFTDAEHDARRRDFTINGLFEDPLAYEGDPADAAETSESSPPSDSSDSALPRIIDYVGGVGDIEAGVVRAIGDPAERFAEDYLRMLRAARFAARFGFELAPETAAAIRPIARYLGQISRERIGIEVEKMLTGPAPAAAAELVQRLRLDGSTLSEDHADPGLPTLSALPPRPTCPAALAAWLIDRHARSRDLPGLTELAYTAGRTIDRWRKGLCLTNDHRNRLRRLIAGLPEALVWEELGKAERKRLLADEAWPELEALLRALPGAEVVRRIEAEAPGLRREGVAPPPLLNGGDLIELGMRPGPRFKRLLEGVYDQQLAGDVADREAALAWVRAQPAGER